MIDEQNSAASLAQLTESLSRLAASSVRQTEYLAELGVAPLADELGLEFEDFYKPLKSLLTDNADWAEASASLKKLDCALDRDNLGWTVDDLQSAEWAEIRRLAAAVLAASPANTDLGAFACTTGGG
ncbi:hypothetical protein OG474_11400 [Kribbella sp. NBC_01505]|uniref:hypothetical protein n=1 Tax=Kribbella sp. NBC_01505 TaxID=2903580 RepID=UPI00386588C7